MRKDRFEEVFYYDWYDGPISGVSHRNGNPYFFVFQGYKEGGSESYYLTPIDEDILQLAIESWEIWKRWDVAFHSGETSKETHPYLPNDKERGEQLRKVLDDVLKIDESNFIELNAEFKVKEKQEKVLGQKAILVKWEEK